MVSICDRLFFSFHRQAAVILVLVTISSPTVFSQNKDIQAIGEAMLYTNLVSDIKYWIKESPEEAIKQEAILSRELVNGFFEEIIQFERRVQDSIDENIGTIFTYKLNVLHRSKRVGYFKLYKVESILSFGKPGQLNVVLKTKTNNLFKTKMYAAYNDTYKQALKWEDLFSTGVVYGANCGMAGINPKYKSQLDSLIKYTDTARLDQWLRSSTVELQLYAIDGLLALEKQGIVIKPYTYFLFDRIRTKKGKAQTCSGCVYMQCAISEQVDIIYKKHGKE